MPGGPENITQQVSKDASSKTETTASDHPIHQGGETKGEKVRFRHHEANPGPVIPKDFNVQQEGTKEERQAKAQALNQ